MKIITDSCVYVQRNDIAFLKHTGFPIPSSIFFKVFDNERATITDNDSSKFVKFDEDNEIEYFRMIDFIVDYNSVKDLSEEQIMELVQCISREKENIALKFSTMSKVEQKNNVDLTFEYERLNFKMDTLIDILHFKLGDSKIKLPRGVEYPSNVQMNTGKGLRRLLSRFKKN